MFDISLQIRRDALAKAEPGQVGNEYELVSLESQIAAACELLQESKVAEFRMVLCSEEPWPVDTWLDLASFLEQVTGVLKMIGEGGRLFHVDMWEEGIEAMIVLHRVGDMVRVRCSHRMERRRLSFVTPGAEATVPTVLVAYQIGQLVQAFAECCERVCPQILALAAMQMWRREVARHVEKIIGPRV